MSRRRFLWTLGGAAAFAAAACDRRQWFAGEHSIVRSIEYGPNGSAPTRPVEGEPRGEVVYVLIG